MFFCVFAPDDAMGDFFSFFSVSQNDGIVYNFDTYDERGCVKVVE